MPLGLAELCANEAEASSSGQAKLEVALLSMFSILKESEGRYGKLEKKRERVAIDPYPCDMACLAGVNTF